MNSWAEHSARVLVALKLREDDPDAARKVHDAYPFGERRYWPYKEWLKMVRRYYPWLRRPGTKGKALETDLLTGEKT